MRRNRRAAASTSPIRSSCSRLVKTDPKYRFSSRAGADRVRRGRRRTCDGRRCRNGFRPDPEGARHRRAVSGVPREVGARRAVGAADGGRQARQVPDQRLQRQRAEQGRPRVDGVSRGVSRSPPAGRARARAEGACTRSRVLLRLRLRRGMGALHGTPGRRDGSVLLRPRSTRPARQRSVARGAARRRLRDARPRVGPARRRSTT